MYQRLFREAGAPGGGGAPPLPPSMQEIEAAAKEKLANDGKLPDKQDGGGIKPGDGKDQLPIIPTLPAPEGKIYNPQGEIVDDPNYKAPDPILPPAGKKFDVDGKTLVDDPDYVAPEDVIEEEVNFWEEVEKRTGKKVEVKYPEGVEPDTIEGAAVREQAVREHAINEWEENMRREFPRALAYMVHHMEGGSDTEFLNNERGVSLPERATVEESVEVQTQFVKGDLLRKGVDEDVADAQVAKLIKDNKLKDKSLTIYDAVKTGQATELQQVETRKKQMQAQVDNTINTFTTKIEKMLPDLDFIVPEANKKQFMDFFVNNLQYDRTTNKFIIVQDFNIDDPKLQLQSLFLQHVAGDLTKIIKKKVSTEAAQKLRLRATKTQTKPINQSDNTNKTQSYVPLGSMGPK